MPEPEHPALALARAQVDRLRAGDADAFLGHEAEYLAACDGALSAAGANPGLIAQLAALHADLLAGLQADLDATATSISRLSARRRVNSAYRPGTPATGGPGFAS